MDARPIGVFDSGIGGLTVVKQIIDVLPNENIIYVGDTARVPYGTRGKEVITRFALEVANFLIHQNVKCLVVACNTISATALDEIQTISPVPVIGVITPAAREAVKKSSSKNIGIIGTSATVNSKAYERELENLDTMVNVIAQACPVFVPLAEEGLTEHEATRLIAKDYLTTFNNTAVDTLILGCTHYPVLKNIIQQTVGENVTLIDSAKPTAVELKTLLENMGLQNGFNIPRYKFYVTDAPDRVNKVAQILFQGELPGTIEKINL